MFCENCRNETKNGYKFRNKCGVCKNPQRCSRKLLELKLTAKVKYSRTNSKAERVIRTTMNMWHSKHIFKNRNRRKVELIRFVNYYK